MCHSPSLAHVTADFCCSGQDNVKTGKQRLLDMKRAKWQSFENMQPYYRTHVEALLDEGIIQMNDKYSRAHTYALYPPPPPMPH